jgi:hypothetical protein
MELIGKVADLNNQGIAQEKRSDIARAILCYEEHITLRWPATHACERLMVIYDRLKTFDEEIRVIQVAIEVFNTEKECRKTQGIDTANIEQAVNKYMSRLEKVLKKQEATGTSQAATADA